MRNLHNSRRRARAVTARVLRTTTTEQISTKGVELAHLALNNYVPSPLNCRVNLYNVDVQTENWLGWSFNDPYNGWQPFVSAELDVTRLPCRHYEVFEDHQITHLASALIAHLQIADATLDVQ